MTCVDLGTLAHIAPKQGHIPASNTYHMPKSNPTPAKYTHHGRLAFLLKDSFLYGVASAISKGFSLITFPLLAWHFSVDDYGLLDFLLVVTTLLTVFFIFGQDSTVARFFYDQDDKDIRREIVSQSLVLQFSGLVFLLPFLWLGSDFLTRHVIDSPERVLLFKLILLQVPFFLLMSFSQNLLRWTFSRTRFLIISLGFAAVQALSLLLLVMFYDIQVYGVLIVFIINNVVFGTLGVVFIWDWLTVPKSFSRLKTTVPFAIPFGCISLIGALSPTLERALTANLLGAESLGLYAVASKIAMLIGIFASAFHSAWGPFSLSIHKEDDAGVTYNIIFKMYALVACLLVLLITLLAQTLILLLASSRYQGAVITVFPLVMGLAIQGIGWIPEIGIGISKRSYLYLFPYLASLLTMLAGVWIMAPHWGLLGVGLATLFGQIVKASLSYWLSQKVYRLPWHYRPVVAIVLLTLVMGMGSLLARKAFGEASSNMVLLGSILMVTHLGWYCLLDKRERLGVTNLVRSSVSRLRSNKANKEALDG